jgi:hypothetical protein
VALIDADSEVTAGGRSSVAVPIGALALVCAVIVFGFEINAISAVNGWWTDELFSIWASDPTLALGEAVSRRITSDTNPPLYYAALYAIRHVIADERIAMLSLNIGFLALTLTLSMLVARRAGLIGSSLLAGAAFILSGPVLRYVVEGRAYLMSLAISYLVAWLCAQTLEGGRSRVGTFSFGALGVLAALTHLYAALFCGCLAAGMVGCSLFYRRQDLLYAGLVLGMTASLVSGIWIWHAGSTVGRVGWMDPLSLKVLVLAAWEIKALAFGSRVGLALFAAVCLTAVMVRDIRPIVLAFTSCLFLFALLPILVSLKQPLIAGRYWMIGTPIVFVFLAFLLRAEFMPMEKRLAPSWLGGVISMGVVVCLATVDVGGFAEAKDFTAAKPIWRGAAIVSPLAHDCPPRSVRVNGALPDFAFAAHMPESLFIDSGDISVTSPDGICPVVGWAEHVRKGDDFLKTASDADLLAVLSIDAPAGSVRVIRHSSGFVVLRNGVADGSAWRPAAGAHG